MKRGEKVFFDAVGRHYGGGRAPPENDDADGARGWLGGVSFLLPGSAAWRLFARFGSQCRR